MSNKYNENNATANGAVNNNNANGTDTVGDDKFTEVPKDGSPDDIVRPQSVTELAAEEVKNQKSTFEKTIGADVRRQIEGAYLKKGSLKLMNGINGGGFYVRYLQDCVRKIGYLQVIIEYLDKSCISVTLFKNALREVCDDDKSSVYKVNVKEAEDQEKEMEKIGVKGLNEPIETYAYNAGFVLPAKFGDVHVFDAYSAPDMPIPTLEIWRRIVDNYTKIPVVQTHETSTLADIYWEMEQLALSYVEAAKQNKANVNTETEGEKETEGENDFMVDEVYFRVSTEDFRNVIEKNNHIVKEVRTAFDTLGLFCRSKSTQGYQYPKKVNGDFKRCYTIYRDREHVFSEEEGTHVTELADMKYCENAPTDADRRIHSLETENEKLTTANSELKEQLKLNSIK